MLPPFRRIKIKNQLPSWSSLIMSWYGWLLLLLTVPSKSLFSYTPSIHLLLRLLLDHPPSTSNPSILVSPNEKVSILKVSTSSSTSCAPHCLCLQTKHHCCSHRCFWHLFSQSCWFSFITHHSCLLFFTFFTLLAGFYFFLPSWTIDRQHLKYSWEAEST